MSVNFVSPGVYSNEIDFSQYVSTLSNTSFGVVGTASRGPVNTPVLITNAAQLYNTFGTLNPNFISLYAATQFLRHGNNLWFVRAQATGTPATSATIALPVDTEITPRVSLTATANTPGTWANSTVSVTSAAGTQAGTFKLTVLFNGAVAEIWDSLVMWPTTSATYALNIVNGPNGNSNFITLVDTFETFFVPWAALATLTTGKTTVQVVAGVSYVFKVTTAGTTGASAPTWLASGTVTDATVTWTNEGAITTLNPSPGTVTLAGGTDGLTGIADSDYIGTISGQSATGLQNFNPQDLIDINLVAVPGISTSAVSQALISLAAARGDCLALLDPPFGLTPTTATNWTNATGTYTSNTAINSSYCAVYWPWCKIYDAKNAQFVWIPPSGCAADVIANTDRVADPWFAPAGLTRGLLLNVLDVEYHASIGDRNLLYSGGNIINPIVNFPKYGVTIWGQRTGQRLSSDLDRINVRRMLLFAEKTISTACLGLVFEPNDPTLWRQFTNLVSPALANIQAHRGLAQFSVRMDQTSMTALDVANKVARGNIFVQAVNSAEILVINFILSPQGASFSEFIASNPI